MQTWGLFSALPLYHLCRAFRRAGQYTTAHNHITTPIRLTAERYSNLGALQGWISCAEGRTRPRREVLRRGLLALVLCSVRILEMCWSGMLSFGDGKGEEQERAGWWNALGLRETSYQTCRGRVY